VKGRISARAILRRLSVLEQRHPGTTAPPILFVQL
jgi:hypothetical protein